jgi:hypothetical protein
MFRKAVREVPEETKSHTALGSQVKPLAYILNL